MERWPLAVTPWKSLVTLTWVTITYLGTETCLEQAEMLRKAWYVRKRKQDYSHLFFFLEVLLSGSREMRGQGRLEGSLESKEVFFFFFHVFGFFFPFGKQQAPVAYPWGKKDWWCRRERWRCETAVFEVAGGGWHFLSPADRLPSKRAIWWCGSSAP